MHGVLNKNIHDTFGNPRVQPQQLLATSDRETVEVWYSNTQVSLEKPAPGLYIAAPHSPGSNSQFLATSNV